MPRRQQMPFNWGMSQGQMNPFQHPSYHPMMNRKMGSRRQMRRMGQNRQNGGMGQWGQWGQNTQMGSNRQFQRKQGGGLLAKIFRKTPPPQQGGFPGMYPITRGGATAGGTAGSLLKSFTDPAAISGFLNNTQQVLQAAKQISPIISQYGPLIRNFPALWKLYRSLKDTTDDSDEHESSSKGAEESSSNQQSRPTVESSSSEESSEESNTTSTSTNHSQKTVSYKKINRTQPKNSEDFDLDDIDVIPFDSHIESVEQEESVELEIQEDQAVAIQTSSSSKRESSHSRSSSVLRNHRITSSNDTSSEERKQKEKNINDRERRSFPRMYI